MSHDAAQAQQKATCSGLLREADTDPPGPVRSDAKRNCATTGHFTKSSDALALRGTFACHSLFARHCKEAKGLRMVEYARGLAHG